MESSEHSPKHSRNNDLTQSNPLNEDALNNNNNITKKTTNELPIKQNRDSIASVDKLINENENVLETVYGTYDSKTNSITIIMDDDSIAVNEAVEEIYSDGESPHSPIDEINLHSQKSPASHLNLNNTSDTLQLDDDILIYDPLDKYLEPNANKFNFLSKSPPLSIETAISDHGYESIMGSPSPINIQDTFEQNPGDDFPWEHSFKELFPSLL